MKQRILYLLAKRRLLVMIGALAAASAAVYGVAHFSARSPTVPTFQVKRSEFLDALEIRGQLKAMKSVTITAPANAGDLQIIRLAGDGTQVKKGDVVVEFDPSKTQQDLAQDQSALKSSHADIEKVRAEGRLNEEVDTTAVMKAKYDVEVAKLDASKSEVVSRIEGAEAKLKLADAERALRQAEEQLKSDTAVDGATIQGKKNANRKAEFDAQRAETALSSMTLKAPSDGTVSLLSIWHNGGEAPFKAGERAWPGTPIAELPDPPPCASRPVRTKLSAAGSPSHSRSRYNWTRFPIASSPAKLSTSAPSPLPTFPPAGPSLATSILKSQFSRRTDASNPA